MSKRYYWLKLNENFFEKEEVQIIEGMPNGEKYINFYLKLLLKSISSEGKLMFRSVIPYTPEMLATITRTDIDTVRVATDLFIKLGLMSKLSDGALFMVETQNMIGSETSSAKRVREHRQRKNNLTLQCNNEVTTGNKNVQKSNIEKEREIDIEKEKDIDIEKESSSNSNLEIYKYYEASGFGLLNKTLMEIIDAAIEIYGSVWVKDAMTEAVKQNKYKFSYAEGILRNWKAEGRKNNNGSNKQQDTTDKKYDGFKAKEFRGTEGTFDDSKIL